MGQTTTARISWLDMAKGYGTLLVIMGHLGVGGLNTWIYSFHIPLFFFLSGYVFSLKYEWKTFIKKKCKSIIIPYFCLGVPMVLFELFLQFCRGTFTVTKGKDLFKELFFQQRFWAIWFLACLFFINILFFFVVKLCKKEWQIALVSVALCFIGLFYYHNGGTAFYWNMDVCMTAIPFFALGYLYKMHASSIDDWLKKKRNSIALFFACGMINVITWRLSIGANGLGLEMFKSNYGNPVFTYISAFAGIFCVVIFSKWFTCSPVLYIGENSMIYYAWHQTIMIPVMSKCMSIIGGAGLLESGTVGTFVYKALMMLGIVAVLTICNVFIRKMKLDFMIGK